MLGHAGAWRASRCRADRGADAAGRARWRRSRIDPTDPCIFQLSGGTTGIPKLIPRTHNDYAYNSKTAAPVCGVTGDSVLLLVLPIAHNLPLACPGMQGFMFKGGEGGAARRPRGPRTMFALIQRHRVTHIKVVPALLIRLINDPSIGELRPVVGAAHPERRPAHAARGAAAHAAS